MEPLGTKPALDLPVPLVSERRRRVRMKVHTPAYASLGNTAHDLSAILDVSDEGIRLQTATHLQRGQPLDLCLDLSENSVNIRALGHVVWSDAHGHAGIRLLPLPDASRQQLQQWLFLNAMAACANPESRPSNHVEPPVDSPSESSVPPDYTSVLAGLAAVKKEVEALGANLAPALQLVAERAQAFTHAGGAAIALLERGEMVCRASAAYAPSLGARLHIGSGFSGECVRSGTLLRCEDAEADPRVDRESCRALGIRSMIAVPVRVGDVVAGLLEVFAPHAHAFNSHHDAILRHLAECTATLLKRVSRVGAAPPKPRPSAVAPPSVPPVAEMPRHSPVVDEAAAIDHSSSSLFRKAVLVMAGLTLFLVVVWLVAPSIIGSSPRLPSAAPARATPPPAPKPAVTMAEVSNLEGLRKLAEQGDAPAQFAMGARYATGEEVKQDYSEAVRWFGLAAEQGHVNAQAMLGAYYGVGRGVPQDLDKAYFWSILAQAGGDQASKYRIPLLVSHMSRAQIVAAQQQANDWLKQHPR